MWELMAPKATDFSQHNHKTFLQWLCKLLIVIVDTRV